MTSKTDLPAVRPALQDVSLIDAPACAAPGDMSVSWWHAEVAARRAPQPVVRMPRCTRWKLEDVRAFWIEFASMTAESIEVAELVTARAKQASAKAREPAAVAKAKATRKASITARTTSGAQAKATRKASIAVRAVREEG